MWQNNTFFAGMKMNSGKKWWLYPLTGILLFAAWPMSPLTVLVFLAWIPLLHLEKTMENGARFFWVAWLNMFIWNISTTWWIWNASPGGAAGAIVANSLLMCFPLMAFRLTRRAAGDLLGYLSLPLYWITFEYIHHNWELSWPWLTLGNIFSTHPGWVQWYEYTGTTGGSVWVWATNIFVLVSFLRQGISTKKWMHAVWIMLLTGPLLISILIENNLPATKTGRDNVVVVQPNVEPYTVKFNTPPELLVQSLIALSETKMDTNTRLLVWPETAIPAQSWEHKLAENEVFQPVYAFLQKHPQILLVTGIDSYKYWGTEKPGTFSIRKMNDGSYYEAFNTAMGASANTPLQLYHKSKLVPGVESLPSWLGFMSSLFDDLGGTTGSLGRSDSAMVLTAPNNPYKAAPIICYESIYSNYVTDYVRTGANILTVITNDGWWGKTPGYQQHMSMSRLRAIENRMYVARSANTGISCFIDPAGNVLQPQPWDTQAAIKMNIPPMQPSFYARHGDWMSRMLWPLAVLIFAWAIFKRIMLRKKRF
jgi:apolipoprotein N-acyltransferase